MQESTFIIYNASAGSGKTFTLAKSYLKILIQSQSNHKFKSILALTFTNKAVGEMKNRIIQMLTLFSSDTIMEEPNPMFKAICDELSISEKQLHERSKKILKHIVHNYGGFDISTIDGFTYRVIKTFTNDLSLPSNFEVELDQDRLLSRAVDNLIAKAGVNNELTKALIDFAIDKADDDRSWDISYDFNKISKLLVNENNYTEIQSLKDKTIKDYVVLKQKISSEIKENKKKISTIANETLQLISESGLEHSNFSRSTLPKHFVKASELNLKGLYNNKLEENLRNDSNLYSNKLDDGIKTTIQSILPEIEQNYKALKQQVYHFTFLKAVKRNITPLSVLNGIQHELSILKNEQSKMLISEFHSIISEEIKDQPTPFIYERLGEKYKHFFIDEFQDTSKLQWENLIPLLDNALSTTQGSVMIVGDAKQAIYRWRGGEAEQFLRLYTKASNPFQIETQIHTLGVNYRSALEIVQFNNSFFEYVGQNYFSNETYADLFKNANQTPFFKDAGYVNIAFMDIQKEDDQNALYANKVLDHIKTCKANGYRLKDICIIVRKRKEGVTIANHLSQHGIAITSSETLLLKNSYKVQFLHHFLKLITQPNNDQLKVKVLSFIATERQIEDKHRFFETHLKDTLDDFFESLEMLDIYISKQEIFQLSTYELIEYLIRTFKLNTDSDAYLQFYLDVVLEFSQKERSDLTTFISLFEEKQDKLSIINPEHLDAVRIMTIHKAKGLEFPIVIFPFADLNIYSELEPKIWFPVEKDNFEGFNNLLINYNSNVEHYGETGQTLYNQHQAQLELDNINLLYVALTRAVKQLFIISKKDVRNKNTYSSFLAGFLKYKGLWSETQLDYSFGKLQKNTNTNYTEDSPSSINLYSSSRAANNLSIITSSGLLWDTKQEKAIERGNIIHLILSKIIVPNDLQNAFEELLQAGLIRSEEIEALKPIVTEVIQHPELKGYYKDGYTVYNERDIITKSNVHLRPDRLNINANNEVIIIDYKTGSPKAFHEDQLHNYELVLNSMKFKVKKRILVYINDRVKVVEI